MSLECDADGVVALSANNFGDLDLSGIFPEYIDVLLAMLAFQELRVFLYKRLRFLCSMTKYSEDTFVTLV